ncbi:unnamed protein product [Paramecium sonneborni]|uniref:Transmembrane protein n=1 Tax=Paramecium sonneborni TaxID=65129 RepID=A0A8S1M8N9_9CILI|nr:unnamed protein product [Paramecium sonneborni]
MKTAANQNQTKNIYEPPIQISTIKFQIDQKAQQYILMINNLKIVFLMKKQRRKYFLNLIQTFLLFKNNLNHQIIFLFLILWFLFLYKTLEQLIYQQLFKTYQIYF